MIALCKDEVTTCSQLDPATYEDGGKILIPTETLRDIADYLREMVQESLKSKYSATQANQLLANVMCLKASLIESHIHNSKHIASIQQRLLSIIDDQLTLTHW